MIYILNIYFDYIISCNSFKQEMKIIYLLNLLITTYNIL